MPWVLRRTWGDQEEAVSVCACMSVFAGKRKGGTRRNCMYALTHIWVCLHANLFTHCICMWSLHLPTHWKASEC